MFFYVFVDLFYFFDDLLYLVGKGRGKDVLNLEGVEIWLVFV